MCPVPENVAPVQMTLKEEIWMYWLYQRTCRRVFIRSEQDLENNSRDLEHHLPLATGEHCCHCSFIDAHAVPVFYERTGYTIVTEFPVSWLPALLVPLAYGLHFFRCDNSRCRKSRL